MTYADFLVIAEYGNKNWKGNFTSEEVRENARIYYADFKWSKVHDVIADSIKSLTKNLIEDTREMPDLEEPKKWLFKMASELGLIDMDWSDFLDTDEWLREF